MKKPVHLYHICLKVLLYLIMYEYVYVCRYSCGWRILYRSIGNIFSPALVHILPQCWIHKLSESHFSSFLPSFPSLSNSWHRFLPSLLLSPYFIIFTFALLPSSFFSLSPIHSILFLYFLAPLCSHPLYLPSLLSLLLPPFILCHLFVFPPFPVLFFIPLPSISPLSFP